MGWKTVVKDPVLWSIAVAATIVHCYALDWGTTNRERAMLVFQSEARLKELSPAMVKARQALYEWIGDSSTQRPSVMRTDEKPPFERYQATQGQPPERLSPGILNSMRSYLLRSTDPDEQQILSSLGNMNPLKGDFDPNEYKYGGSYLYALAGFLAIGMVAGVTHLTSDISYYFLHPEHLSGIFTVCRFLGALSNVLTALLLYHWGKAKWNRATGITAALLYASSPLIITYGHIAKPNTYSAFWLVLALYVLDRHVIPKQTNGQFSPSIKQLGTVGTLLGFSIGAFVVSGIGLMFVALWLTVLTAFDFKKTFQLTAVVTAGSAIGFLLTNPYYLFSIGHVIDVYSEHTGGSGGWGYAIPSLSKLAAVIVPFPAVLGFLAFAGLIVGAVVDIQKRQVFALISLICFTMVSIFMGMNRFLIPIVPFFCLIAGYGLDAALSKVGSKPVRAALLSLGAIFLAVQTLQVLTALSQDNTHRNRVGTWIERNVPAGSEIAVLGQKPVFWRTPPFAFENYPLTIFYQTDTGFIREMNPAWIVDQIRYRLTVEEKQNTPEAIPPDRYEIAHRFDPPKILGFIPAVTPGYEFPCQSIVIWKRAE